ETVKIARQKTSRIFEHTDVGFVEPARNFAITKATYPWILLIDADEVLPDTLGKKLKGFTTQTDYTYYRIPRRNLIFRKWMRHSGWWPDYQIRFFQKNAVSWNNEIHSLPVTQGAGMDLPQIEDNAFIHYHYETVEQYLNRLNRYTTHEAAQLGADNYQFSWPHIIQKPMSEFLTRFLAWEGYKDGAHGLALSLLQAFSFLIVELKVWEKSRFAEHENSSFLENIIHIMTKARGDFNFWSFTHMSNENHGIKKIYYKLRAKLRL
ncbi:MAG: glycosyltransferase family 2 protein, partial [Patescibacteria group bacterium]